MAKWQALKKYYHNDKGKGKSLIFLIRKYEAASFNKLRLTVSIKLHTIGKVIDGNISGQPSRRPADMREVLAGEVYVPTIPQTCGHAGGFGWEVYVPTIPQTCGHAGGFSWGGLCPNHPADLPLSQWRRIKYTLIINNKF